MRPPYGHPNTSRQRIFLNNRAVKAPQLSKTIEEIFTESYRAVIKMQGRAPTADLLSLRKATNLHPMFLLDLYCSPELVEIIPEPGGGIVLMEDWAPVVKAVREAVLSAWDAILNTALLSEIESYKERRDKEGEAGELRGISAARRGGVTDYSLVFSRQGPSWSKSAPGRLGTSKPSTASKNFTYNSLKQSSSVLRLPPQGGEPSKRASSFNSASKLPRQSASSSFVSVAKGDVDPQALPPLLPPKDPSLPSSSYNSSLMNIYRQRRETSRPRMAEGSAPAALPRKRQHPSSATLITTTLPAGSGLYSLGPSAPSPPSAPSGLDLILSNWKNPAMMPAASGAAHAIATLDAVSSAMFVKLRPEVLAREDLQSARSLQQIDTKFIPIVCSTGVLALVDQHAADERVQLERLKFQIVAPTGGPANGTCPSLVLPQPQPLRLGADEVPLVAAYGEAAMAWGWQWTLYRASASAPEALMEVIAVPVIATRALTATDLRLYLHDMAATHGGAGPPAGVIRVLNSKACRSAIMFGDELVHSQCQNLVDALQDTQMCFICAHGRPTTVPLVDLIALGKATSALQASRGQRVGSRSGPEGGSNGLKGLKAKLIAALGK